MGGSFDGASQSSSDDISVIDRRVSSKYEVGAKLGKGAYGIVWKATVLERGGEKAVPQKDVALKKIFDAFQNSTDAQRTYREILYLKQMGEHENVVKLLNVLKAENDRDIYLVFEYLETDLHAAILANILEDVHKQYIMHQAFKALTYMHSAGLVHRDMKPANLLLNADCVMKVADFGLARSLSEIGGDDLEGGKLASSVLTDYVATRWYRAPEVLVGSTSYGKQVDLWSLGCIFAEMLSGRPAFPGKSTLDMLEKIATVLGKPSDAQCKSLHSPFTATMMENVAYEKLNCGERTREEQLAKWAESFPTTEADAVDLLSKLLQYNPTERLTAIDGLTHPYCEQFFPDGSKPEVAASRVVTSFADKTLSEDKKRDTHFYREQLYRMIDELKPAKRNKGKADRENSSHNGGSSAERVASPYTRSPRASMPSRS